MGPGSTEVISSRIVTILMELRLPGASLHWTMTGPTPAIYHSLTVRGMFWQCETKKASSRPTCPCVTGGEWIFRGEAFSFCADPSNCGLEWCTTDVKECGEAFADEKTRITMSMCVGRTFDGEPQSYCQKPNGIGLSKWCPKDSKCHHGDSW